MKYWERFIIKLIAVYSVITSRTFSLTFSYSKPSDFEHITESWDIREDDLKKK